MRIECGMSQTWHQEPMGKDQFAQLSSQFFLSQIVKLRVTYLTHNLSYLSLNIYLFSGKRNANR